ncbi:MAG: hypothetical protein A2499_18215 [Stygiobacter sp. RIFOXYC12_FULL_38_8]|nr:MAG: hypothetical protein A2X62_16185 [Stygiobacter sp. GWC2_38_9]OGU84374.1 MAG: hypothetical protein A2279_12960 [Stygiobacter sp. RIFOXYA12_FULL_38_9]OGV09746.1 MAG: hypothetical protein A2299_14485 [Stygiobacter sp. RIFOXYB2_FULL_37_11]OGV13614.1 MAG: hypothetical protein A2440_10615 [Stygiobacter sp. RIFOXYC2_FULL_38_25]OGV16118.1 MAG: hypothetical protein A2237_09310 [Stygiobacter sp. RIFOXYA2_FULL_38_8]OGV27389.1 MAG: hypothetical protein A2499_18215 [Stygiobacter sp. RIFOXYC12_FULL_
MMRFTEGKLDLEYDGKLDASSISLILDSNFYSKRHSWKEIADEDLIRNHNYKGNTLYGIEVLAEPDFRRMKVTRKLYDARKEIAKNNKTQTNRKCT